MSDLKKEKLKSRLIISLGMLCLALYFVLDHYTNTPDFFLGLFVGLSVGLNLVGVFLMVKWLRRLTDKAAGL
ncbi:MULTISPECIES: hypothetical protein [unclassified Carboxylicivirga]|uniref:hypothetical protein n=1 Tax=Carboxylicivirga TaxID=1628153 RepID=UPI003D343D10